MLVGTLARHITCPLASCRAVFGKRGAWFHSIRRNPVLMQISSYHVGGCRKRGVCRAGIATVHLKPKIPLLSSHTRAHHPDRIACRANCWKSLIIYLNQLCRILGLKRVGTTNATGSPTHRTRSRAKLDVLGSAMAGRRMPWWDVTLDSA